MTSNAEQTPTPPEFVKCPDCRNGFTDGGYSCPTCTGTGEVPAPPTVKCPRCEGNGRVEMLEHCPVCNGSGTIPANAIKSASVPTPPERVKCPRCVVEQRVSPICPRCNGTGYLPGEVPAPPAEQEERRWTIEKDAGVGSIRGPDTETVEVVPLSNPADDAELVERVARALWAVNARSFIAQDRWEDENEATHEHWLDEARTALQTEQAES